MVALNGMNNLVRKIMKIKKLNDKQCLELFQELLADRIKIGTAYVTDEQTGVLTHQVLIITAGDVKVQSAPEKLRYPLLPIINNDNNTTVN